MRRYIYLLLVSFLVSSCADSDIKETLDNSEALMQESPDMALDYLMKCNNGSISSKQLRARHSLLLSQAYDKNYIDIASDSLTNIAVDYYGKQRRDSFYKMLSFYYHGIVLKNSQSFIPSILYFEKAERIALRQNSFHYLGLINRNKADIMVSMNNSWEAINYTKQAINYFNQAKELDNVLYERGSLAILYVNDRQFAIATALIDSLINENLRDSLFLSSILLSKCEMLIEQGKASKEALNIYSNIDTSYYYFSDWAYSAYILNSLGVKDSADIVINRAYSHAINNLDSATVDGIYSRINASRGHYSDAYRLLDNASHIQDSLAREILHQSANIAQRDFFKKEAQYQALKNRTSRQKLILLSILCLLIIGIGYLSFQSYRNKKEEIIKDQMAQLAFANQKADTLVKDNAGILGALLSERLGHLDRLSAEYFSAKTEKEKEAVINEYKKKVALLRKDDFLIDSLENDLNRFCNGLMTRLQEQVPEIRGDNRRLICLFFAGLSNLAVQIITGKVSLKSVEMSRSRCRKIIKVSGAKDAKMFLELLDNPKTATGR